MITSLSLQQLISLRAGRVLFWEMSSIQDLVRLPNHCFLWISQLRTFTVILTCSFPGKGVAYPTAGPLLAACRSSETSDSLFRIGRRKIFRFRVPDRVRGAAGGQRGWGGRVQRRRGVSRWTSLFVFLAGNFKFGSFGAQILILQRVTFLDFWASTLDKSTRN